MTLDFNNVTQAYGLNDVPLSKIYGSGDYLLWPVIQPTPPEPSEYASQYLTFEFLDSGTWIFRWIKLRDRNDILPNYVSIQYKLNNNNWVQINSSSINTINVSSGDIIKVKGLNDTYWGGTVEPTYGNDQLKGMNNFGTGTARFNLYGNIMSLVYGDNFANNTSITKNGVFRSLFMYAPVVSAENLVMASTSLTQYCYTNMFNNCTNLTHAPKLPASTLVSACYEYMFSGCSALSNVICYASDISAPYCTYDWLYQASSTGTFTKASGASWPTGDSGIPSGWTVRTI